MGEVTGIAWTDHTFNPWWGCVEVAPECEHCYARVLSKRYGEDVWGQLGPRRTFGQRHWDEPLRWDKRAQEAGVRRRVFCASMADVFERHPAIEYEREELWKLIEKTPNLDWLLLTKRPQNIASMVPWQDKYPDNVWLGTSVGHVESTWRANVLADHRDRASVLFLSVEPLLTRIDYLPLFKVCTHARADSLECQACPGGRLLIDWVIVGGESGAGSRRMDPEWVREIQTRCRHAGVSFFFKQAGEVLAREWGCKDKKGGVLSEIPEEFRVQEFPARTWSSSPLNVQAIKAIYSG